MSELLVRTLDSDFQRNRNPRVRSDADWYKAEELAWLGERIRLLHETVATICAVRVDHTSDSNVDGVP